MLSLSNLLRMLEFYRYFTRDFCVDRINAFNLCITKRAGEI